MITERSLFACLVAAAVIGYQVLKTVYRLHFHPLSKFPGPRAAAISRRWQTKLVDAGYPEVEYEKLHRDFGRCQACSTLPKVIVTDWRINRHQGVENRTKPTSHLRPEPVQGHLQPSQSFSERRRLLRHVRDSAHPFRGDRCAAAQREAQDAEPALFQVRNDQVGTAHGRKVGRGQVEDQECLQSRSDSCRECLQVTSSTPTTGHPHT